MGPSTPFIRRPVATTLLTFGLAAAGVVAFFKLPVSPLPQVDFPTISVQATLPGASPQDVATTVASPLERHLGQIADVTEMTSQSSVGQTRITLQFGLNRDINGAARDVQAAINAARADLPTSLRSNPTYRKVNPADAPILILTLTSDTLTRGELYDAASTVLAQKLSQVEGIGEVVVGGGSLPAVRVDLIPQALYKYGVGLEDVRAALGNTNAHSPKGGIDVGDQRYQIYANDQANKADDYKPLIIAYRNGAPVKLSDVGEVSDAQENIRNAGLANGKPAILIILYRQPGANIISTVDNVRALIPELQSSISPAINVNVVMDRTLTVRASVRDIEITLVISVFLVVMVVFVFLRNVRATIIPSIAVPLSLVGTFGVMYLLGYSLDNLSLMALAISTGFVVDDAIVVLENINRHLEEGIRPVQAAFLGAREIGFTVVSMSTSLVAVFIPILMMGGIVGRLFREFAVTLSAAIGVSLLVSLTTTPMMCAKLLRPLESEKHGRLFRLSENAFHALLKNYAASVRWVLRHQALVLLITIGTACLSVYLYIIVPKGFFPQQDTGRLFGSIQAEQDISFHAIRQKMNDYVAITMKDPAVDTVTAFVGGGGTANTGRMFIMLKPLGARQVSADQVISRLRGKLAHVPGATLFLQSAQDLQIGGRLGNAQYQYTLQSESLDDLNTWAPRMLARIRQISQLKDVNTDQQNRGLEAQVVIDRDTAARLGIQPAAIDAALYQAFGQAQVSTIYEQLNQYHVVMEVDPRYQQSPDALQSIYVPSQSGAMVPLAAFTHFEPSNTPLAVSHQGQFPSVTISFNLGEGVSLGEATELIAKASRDLNLPSSVHASFQGTAAAFQDSLSNQPVLILAALTAVYIVLGMLYESYIHPITILSTLPSAGVGAILALLLTRNELNVIAIIGVLLLIGIVKKNAIMMIDFALDAERQNNLSPEEAIYQACIKRFRPIMMTTAAALLAGLPLALGRGTGSELHRPLGITIVGGLIVSQMLTLFTTPVVYLYMDRLRLRFRRAARRSPGGDVLVQPS